MHSMWEGASIIFYLKSTDNGLNMQTSHITAPHKTFTLSTLYHRHKLAKEKGKFVWKEIKVGNRRLDRMGRG